MNNIPSEIKENDECIDMLMKEYEAHYINSNKGYWIDLDIEGRKIYGCRCSKCQKNPIYFISGYEDWWMHQLPKYCPNCGYEMETNIEENKWIDAFTNKWNSI